MKKMVLVLLAILLVSFTIAALGEETIKSRDGEYEYVLLEDGTAKIYKYRGKEENVTVPTVLDGIPVSTLGQGCYSLSLKSITIQENIQFVEGNPFLSCDKLSQINVAPDHPYLATIDGVLFSKADKCLLCYPRIYEVDSYSIPQGIKKIAGRAFYWCNLSSITIPDSVEEMDGNPFQFSGNLTKFNISSGNQTYEAIDNVLFNKKTKTLVCYSYGLRKKSSYSIPEGTLTIGRSAFSDNFVIENVTIPSSVVTIENAAFSGCDRLSKIVIPDSVTSVGTGIFSLCKNLKSAVLPKGLTVITNRMFAGCEDLRDIELPDGITLIDEYAFSSCESITSINIPKGVTFIGNNAFRGTGLRRVSIPSGVTTIESSTFSSCEKLESVTLPSTITSIGDYAFYEDKKLSSIELPTNLTSIGKSAFEKCNSLVSLILSSSITHIGEEAFEDSYMLTLTVDQDSYAMQYCAENGLKYVFPGANDWLND